MRFSEEGLCAPIQTPLYSHYPKKAVWWKGVIIEFEPKDAEYMRWLAPEILDVEDGKMVAVFTDHYEPAHSTDIHAALLLIPVKYKGISGNYVTNLFVSSSLDELLLADREYWGLPVLSCDRFQLQYIGNQIWAVVKRGEDILMKGSMILDEEGKKEDYDEYKPRRGLMAYKKVPCPDSSRPPLRQLIYTSWNPDTMVVHELYHGRGSLELGTSVWNIHKLEPAKILKTYFIHYTGVIGEERKVLWEDSEFINFYKKL